MELAYTEPHMIALAGACQQWVERAKDYWL
jgi:hypothetical protein